MDPLIIIALLMFIAMIVAWASLPGSASTTAAGHETSVLAPASSKG